MVFNKLFLKTIKKNFTIKAEANFLKKKLIEKDFVFSDITTKISNLEIKIHEITINYSGSYKECKKYLFMMNLELFMFYTNINLARKN